MIEVSVVLPIYNGEKTLCSTLDSLLAQTYKNFEVIACIDGSQDNSELILREYGAQFKKITILKNELNRGLGPTMNRLVHEAKGKYIAIAEQDDYYYPERLQLQVDVLNTNPSIGLVSGIAEFYNGRKVVGKFPGLLVRGEKYPQGVEMFLLNYRNHLKVVNSCIMFRKCLHIDNGLYFTQHYPSISIDWTYILRFSLVSNIHGLPQVLVRLDRRPDRDSVTSNKTKQFKATRELLRAFAYEFPQYIKQEDFDYAMRTQYLLELGRKSSTSYLFKWFQYYLKCPTDRRYINNITSRIRSKFLK